MKKSSAYLLAFTLLFSSVAFSKGKSSKAKKAEMTRLCKEENPDANKKLIKKCVRDKMNNK